MKNILLFLLFIVRIIFIETGTIYHISTEYDLLNVGHCTQILLTFSLETQLLPYETIKILFRPTFNIRNFSLSLSGQSKDLFPLIYKETNNENTSYYLKINETIEKNTFYDLKLHLDPFEYKNPLKTSLQITTQASLNSGAVIYDRNPIFCELTLFKSPSPLIFSIKIQEKQLSHLIQIIIELDKLNGFLLEENILYKVEINRNWVFMDYCDLTKDSEACWFETPHKMIFKKKENLTFYLIKPDIPNFPLNITLISFIKHNPKYLLQKGMLSNVFYTKNIKAPSYYLSFLWGIISKTGTLSSKLPIGLYLTAKESNRTYFNSICFNFIFDYVPLSPLSLILQIDLPGEALQGSIRHNLPCRNNCSCFYSHKTQKILCKNLENLNKQKEFFLCIKLAVREQIIPLNFGLFTLEYLLYEEKRLFCQPTYPEPFKVFLNSEYLDPNRQNTFKNHSFPKKEYKNDNLIVFNQVFNDFMINEALETKAKRFLTEEKHLYNEGILLYNNEPTKVPIKTDIILMLFIQPQQISPNPPITPETPAITSLKIVLNPNVLTPPKSIQLLPGSFSLLLPNDQIQSCWDSSLCSNGPSNTNTLYKQTDITILSFKCIGKGENTPCRSFISGDKGLGTFPGVFLQGLEIGIGGNSLYADDKLLDFLIVVESGSLDLEIGSSGLVPCYIINKGVLQLKVNFLNDGVFSFMRLKGLNTGVFRSLEIFTGDLPLDGYKELYEGDFSYVGAQRANCTGYNGGKGAWQESSRVSCNWEGDFKGKLLLPINFRKEVVVCLGSLKGLKGCWGKNSSLEGCLAGKIEEGGHIESLGTKIRITGSFDRGFCLIIKMNYGKLQRKYSVFNNITKEMSYCDGFHYYKNKIEEVSVLLCQFSYYIDKNDTLLLQFNQDIDNIEWQSYINKINLTLIPFQYECEVLSIFFFPLPKPQTFIMNIFFPFGIIIKPNTKEFILKVNVEFNLDSNLTINTTICRFFSNNHQDFDEKTCNISISLQGITILLPINQTNLLYSLQITLSSTFKEVIPLLFNLTITGTLFSELLTPLFFCKNLFQPLISPPIIEILSIAIENDTFFSQSPLRITIKLVGFIKELPKSNILFIGFKNPVNYKILKKSTQTHNFLSLDPIKSFNMSLVLIPKRIFIDGVYELILYSDNLSNIGTFIIEVALVDSKDPLIKFYSFDRRNWTIENSITPLKLPKAGFIIKKKLFGYSGLESMYIFQIMSRFSDYKWLLLDFSFDFQAKFNKVSCFIDNAMTFCESPLNSPQSLLVLFTKSFNFPLNLFQLIILNIIQPFFLINNKIKLTLGPSPTEQGLLNDISFDFDSNNHEILLLILNASLCNHNTMGVGCLVLFLRLELVKSKGFLLENTLFLQLPEYLHYGSLNPSMKFSCFAGKDNQYNLLKNCFLFDPCYLELVFLKDLNERIGTFMVRIDRFPGPLVSNDLVIHLKAFILKPHSLNSVLVQSNDFYLKASFTKDLTMAFYSSLFTDKSCTFKELPIICVGIFQKEGFLLKLDLEIFSRGWFDCGLKAFGENFHMVPNILNLSYDNPSVRIYLAAKPFVTEGIYSIYFEKLCSEGIVHKKNIFNNPFIGNPPILKVYVKETIRTLKPELEEYKVSFQGEVFIVFRMDGSFPIERLEIIGRIGEEEGGSFISLKWDKQEVSFEKGRETAVFIVTHKGPEEIGQEAWVYWELITGKDLKKTLKVIKRSKIVFWEGEVYGNSLEASLEGELIQVLGVKELNKPVFIVYWIVKKGINESIVFERALNKVLNKEIEEKGFEKGGFWSTGNFSGFEVDISDLKGNSEYLFIFWKSIGDIYGGNFSFVTKDNGSRYCRLTFLIKNKGFSSFSETKKLITCLFAFYYRLERKRVYNDEGDYCSKSFIALISTKSYTNLSKEPFISTFSIFFGPSPLQQKDFFSQNIQKDFPLDNQEQGIKSFASILETYDYKGLLDINGYNLTIKKKEENKEPKLPNITFSHQFQSIYGPISLIISFQSHLTDSFVFLILLEGINSSFIVPEIRNSFKETSFRKGFVYKGDTLSFQFENLKPGTLYYLHYIYTGDYAPLVTEDGLYSIVEKKVLDSGENREDSIPKAFLIGFMLCIGIPLLLSLLLVFFNEKLASNLLNNQKSGQKEIYIKELTGYLL